MYDFLIVGAGPFGCTFARLAADAGHSVKVIDKRHHLAGNTYTKKIEGINVHMYGAHIFHTNDYRVWRFVNSYSDWNQYHHKVKALSGGGMYTLPFSLQTMYEMFGCKTPEDAEFVLHGARKKYPDGPQNLEEQALSLVGSRIYETFIRDYTKKQWNRDPTELPASIIKRIPVRFDWNDSYFDDKHVGIPAEGYTELFANMLDGIPIELNTDFFVSRGDLEKDAKTVVYTGPIDAYFGYKAGRLEYRGLKFEHSVLLDRPNFQGTSVVNYCDNSEEFTRIIEHRHFDRNCKSKSTVITKEWPHTPGPEDPVYYPINDEKNVKMYATYRFMADKESNVIFGGRLAEYKYYDMHQVIAAAGKLAMKLGIKSFLK